MSDTDDVDTARFMYDGEVDVLDFEEDDSADNGGSP